LKLFNETLGSLVLIWGLLAGGQASAWSCASDEPLTPHVSVEERARISAEVARERALSEALHCRSEGLADCSRPPTETAVPIPVPVVLGPTRDR
jgi:hypothetical protein